MCSVDLYVGGLGALSAMAIMLSHEWLHLLGATYYIAWWKSDLAVSIRQSMHQAVHALSEAGLHVRMAGNMVKYRQEMEQPWQYVNPRDLTAIDTISTSSRHAGILQNARQCQPRRQTPPSCTGAVSSHKALEELVQPGGGVKRKGMTATGFSPKPRKRERAAGEQ